MGRLIDGSLLLPGQVGAGPGIEEVATTGGEEQTSSVVQNGLECKISTSTSKVRWAILMCYPLSVSPPHRFWRIARFVFVVQSMLLEFLGCFWARVCCNAHILLSDDQLASLLGGCLLLSRTLEVLSW